MVNWNCGDAPADGDLSSLLFLILFVEFLVFFLFQQVAVFAELVLFGLFPIFFLFFFLFDFVGNGIEGYRMRLRNFQFAFAFRAAQDLSLFHFVFVHVNFSGTLGTAEHVSILRFLPAGFRKARAHQPAYYIPGL
jgi:hypothetical protein